MTTAERPHEIIHWTGGVTGYTGQPTHGHLVPKLGENIAYTSAKADVTCDICKRLIEEQA